MTPHAHVARCISGGRFPGDNGGLVLQRLAPPLANQEQYGKFVRAMADTPLSSAYRDAFRRWQRRTPPGGAGRRVLRLRTEGPVLVGMGEPTPGENGLTTSYPWGAPMIPGSALKGVTKAVCAANAPKDSGWAAGEVGMATLFGTGGHEGTAGAVDVLDAWIEPDGRFVDDILTPHQAKYYGGDGDPSGWEGPNPVTFVGAEGHFRIVLEGPEAWLGHAEALLLDALRQHGVGGKTRAGYGRLLRVESLDDADRAEIGRQVAEADLARAKALSSAERLGHLFETYKSRRQELGQALEDLVLGGYTGTGVPELREGPQQLLSIEDASDRAALVASLRSTVARRVRKKGSARGIEVLAVLDRWREAAGDPVDTDAAATIQPRLSQKDLTLVGKEERSGKAREKKIRSLAQRLGSGLYSPSDVQAGLAALASWGAPPGTLAAIHRANGMDG